MLPLGWIGPYTFPLDSPPPPSPPVTITPPAASGNQGFTCFPNDKFNSPVDAYRMSTPRQPGGYVLIIPHGDSVAEWEASLPQLRGLTWSADGPHTFPNWQTAYIGMDASGVSIPPPCIPATAIPPPPPTPVAPPPPPPPVTQQPPPPPVAQPPQPCPPCPVQQQPPLEPPDLCTADTGFKPLVIPRPGSREWCLHEGEIVDAFVLFGLFLEGNWRKGIVPFVCQMETGINKWASSFADVGSIGNAVLKAIGYVVNSLAIAAAQILGAAFASITPLMIPYTHKGSPELVGLYLIRSLFLSLQNVRTGTDAGFWLTADLHFEPEVWLQTVDYVIKIYTQQEVPSVGEAMEAYKYGFVDADTYRCWLRLNGANPDTYDAVLSSRRERLTPEEYIEWCRRNNQADATTQDSLRSFGFLNPDDRQAKIGLYDELPTISDHLHWLQRNVFDDEYVKDYDLLSGFSERFWAKFGQDLRAQGMLEKYAELHYAAHWINPSMGQLFELVRRNRPGRVAKDIEFTETDLLRLMAEQDVAPYFRQRLRNIAYAPFGLRFLRQLFDTGQVDFNELVERFQDLSFSRQDSITMSKGEVIRKARSVATGTRGYTVPTIRKLYEGKALTRQQAVDRMIMLGYEATAALDAITAWEQLAQLKPADEGAKELRKITNDVAREGLAVGVVSRDDAIASFVNTGMSSAIARSYVDGLILKDRIRLTKQGIVQIKRGVMSGRLPIQSAPTLLQHLGLTPDKIQEYINVWTYDLEAGKKQLTASQIVKFACDGEISLDVARIRLLNLGFADPDAMLLVAQAQSCIATNEAKALASQDKIKSQQAAAITKAIKANEAQLARFQKQLSSLGTPSNLLKWLKDGVITAAYARERMLALGLLAADIDAAITDALKPKGGKGGKTKTPGGG